MTGLGRRQEKEAGIRQYFQAASPGPKERPAWRLETTRPKRGVELEAGRFLRKTSAGAAAARRRRDNGRPA
jgi:hypothetical protein